MMQLDVDFCWEPDLRLDEEFVLADSTSSSNLARDTIPCPPPIFEEED